MLAGGKSIFLHFSLLFGPKPCEIYIYFCYFKALSYICTAVGIHRGPDVPYFIRKMITEEKIKKIVESALKADEFLVYVHVSRDLLIDVRIDAYEGISIHRLGEISRLIEGSFDRDVVDFQLDVSSPGLSKAFKVPEQFKKHLNKEIAVRLKNGEKITGILMEHEEDHIVIKFNPGGDEKQLRIALQNVKKARPVIAF